MPTELEEVRWSTPGLAIYTNVSQLVEFISHGNTQVRQLGQSRKHYPAITIQRY